MPSEPGSHDATPATGMAQTTDSTISASLAPARRAPPACTSTKRDENSAAFTVQSSSSTSLGSSRFSPSAYWRISTYPSSARGAWSAMSSMYEGTNEK